MSNPNTNPLTGLANKVAIDLACAQLTLANYFTPFGFEPERADYDRAHPLLDRPISTVFPNSAGTFAEKLERLHHDAKALKENLDALHSAGAKPTLDADALYQEARNRVITNYAPVRAAS